MMLSFTGHFYLLIKGYRRFSAVHSLAQVTVILVKTLPLPHMTVCDEERLIYSDYQQAHCSTEQVCFSMEKEKNYILFFKVTPAG